jgi:hypothetical protein
MHLARLEDTSLSSWEQAVANKDRKAANERGSNDANGVNSSGTANSSGSSGSNTLNSNSNSNSNSTAAAAVKGGMMKSSQLRSAAASPAQILQDPERNSISPFGHRSARLQERSKNLLEIQREFEELQAMSQENSSNAAQQNDENQINRGAETVEVVEHDPDAAAAYADMYAMNSIPEIVEEDVDSVFGEEDVELIERQMAQQNRHLGDGSGLEIDHDGELEFRGHG